MIKKISILAFGISFFSSLMFIPSSSLAYSPIIANCSNGLLNNTFLYVTNNNKVEQLFEVRLDHYYLDAIAVRVKSGGQERLATFIVTDRDDGVIASKTQMVPTEESWLYVDFTDVPMPRAVYLLEIRNLDATQITWKYTSGTCINDSYAINNNNRLFDTDMGFAIYAYDSTVTNQNNDEPIDNPDDNLDDNADINNPGETTNGDLPPGTESSTVSNPTDTSRSTNTTSSQSTDSLLSKEDILNMSRGDNNGLGFFERLMLLSPVISLILGFLFFVFGVGFIILIIWLVRRKKKKNNDTSQKPPEKPKENSPKN